MLFFFTDTAPTEIYTLSLHDALPISILTAQPSDADKARVPHLLYGHVSASQVYSVGSWRDDAIKALAQARAMDRTPRSEEHTSELQSQFHLVCRLLLEKKKKKKINHK